MAGHAHSATFGSTCCSTIDSTEPRSLGPAAMLLHAAHKATAMQGLTLVSAAHLLR